MKIKYILSLSLLLVCFSACNFNYRGKAEDIAIPLIQALQDNDEDDAECLLPPDKHINEVFANNKGVMADVYYNKYSQSYRKDNLLAKIAADFDIAEYLTNQNKLNWDKVALGAVNVEDSQQENTNYSIVTANLRFPEGDYILRYNATQHKGQWYLLNGFYFGKNIPAK